MKKIIYQLLLLVVLTSALSAHAQVIDKKGLENKIDSFIPKHVNDTTPGLVVGIVQKGELIFSKGYGLANLAYGLPNDPEKLYNIGSVSKQFLGYAFAILHEQGKLNIDDPVNQYLENWPEFQYTVTVRHLLSHTSGYREAYIISNLAGREVGVDRLSREECLNVVRRQAELEYVPGSRYTYNSTAWVILAEILEKVTGQPADQWVTENILRPLEMNDTKIEAYVGQAIPNAAESYSYQKGKGYVNEKSNRAIFGAADVFTNVPDLVKWIRNYHTAQLGGKAVQNLFLDPFILNNGSNSTYALGIVNSSYRGVTCYSHTGSHEAFLTQLNYYPDQDLGIIIISNYGRRAWFYQSEIADFLLKEWMESPKKEKFDKIKIKKEELEQFTGHYFASTKNRVQKISISKGNLILNGEVQLVPTSENTFRIKGSEGELQFQRQSDGKMQFTINNGSKWIYTSFEEWTPQASDLKTFVGDYWSSELETLYHFTLTDGKLSIQHRWLDTITLEPVLQDVFKSDWGYYVNFTRDNNGRISGFNICSGRTVDVFFQRQK